VTTYLELNKTLTFEETDLKNQVHRFGRDVLRPAAAALDPLSPADVIASESVFWDVIATHMSSASTRSRFPKTWVGRKHRRWHVTSTPKRWGGPAPTSPSG
jgi:hypothetical protein